MDDVHVEASVLVLTGECKMDFGVTFIQLGRLTHGMIEYTSTIISATRDSTSPCKRLVSCARKAMILISIMYFVVPWSGPSIPQHLIMSKKKIDVPVSFLGDPLYWQSKRTNWKSMVELFLCKTHGRGLYFDSIFLHFFGNIASGMRIS